MFVISGLRSKVMSAAFKHRFVDVHLRSGRHNEPSPIPLSRLGLVLAPSAQMPHERW